MADRILISQPDLRPHAYPGLIVSDAWQGYSGIEPEIYDHQSVSQAAQKRAGGSPSAVPGVDRVTSNLKTWLRGTHHGVGADHLDAYLDEFVFRFNRRYYPMAGFATILGVGGRPGPDDGRSEPLAADAGADHPAARPGDRADLGAVPQSTVACAECPGS